MKQLLTVLLLSACSSLIAQTPIELSRVTEIPGIDQNTLFERSQEWVTDFCFQQEFTLQDEDKSEGYFYITGSFHYSYYDKTSPLIGKISGPVFFKLRIYVREGRYKYRFYEFFHEGGDYGKNLSYGPLYEGDEPIEAVMKRPDIETWKDIKRSVVRDVRSVGESLYLDMSTPTELETEW